MSRTLPTQSKNDPASLILCSRNRPAMLAETVASILAGGAVPDEIVIVDQSDVPHPTLASVAGPRACALRYLWTERVGLSRANNLGIATARHELLVFTHDDVLVTAGWFGALVQALRDGGPRTVVTGRILPTRPAAPGGFAPTLRTDERPAQYVGRVGIDVLKPLNMAMYRSALREVGAFDVRLGPGTPFPGAEDSDLGFRLLEAGYAIRFVPEALLYHRAWRGARDYLPLRWGYGVAQGAFFAKHARAGDLYIPRRVARDLRRRARRFPRRLWQERTRALGDPLFLLGNLVGAARWFLTERGSVEENRIEGVATTAIAPSSGDER